MACIQKRLLFKSGLWWRVYGIWKAPSMVLIFAMYYITYNCDGFQRQHLLFLTGTSSLLLVQLGLCTMPCNATISSQHRNILKTPNIIILFLVVYFFQISLTQWKINSRPVKVDVTSVVVLLHPPYRSPASFKGGLISEGIYNLHKKKM